MSAKDTPALAARLPVLDQSLSNRIVPNTYKIETENISNNFSGPKRYFIKF